ncbi:carboxypeptidase-like regulatory domain-containing protein [Motiliproteus sp. SC1-56]|uniref:carboxypeptidase-like regulatory domain-containing protein n=1 Tax=Motiliproteus sp. SC1-56 TaxID=2799565 RepID=UPI001A8F5F9B|nr:carboxypeptidase-like regulatory domain-containing protein [Motiliproteus sp. SC1-56]
MTRPLTLLALLLLSASAWAHKLHLFAFAEGEQVSGQVYFAGGAPATQATLAVNAQDGTSAASPTVDASGSFTFSIASRQDYLITADAGDGHRAQWTLPSRELAVDLPPAPGISLEVTDDPATSPTAGKVAVTAEVERAVARQVRPLREQLIALEQRLRFQDILGALGYILGLAGLALWWRAKRRPAAPK